MSNDYNNEMDRITNLDTADIARYAAQQNPYKTKEILSVDLEEITNRLDALDLSIISAKGAMEVLREMIMHMANELKRQGIEIK